MLPRSNDARSIDATLGRVGSDGKGFLRLLLGRRRDTKECDVLQDPLIRRVYARGEVAFREGDLGRELFLIARGSASVKL